MLLQAAPVLYLVHVFPPAPSSLAKEFCATKHSGKLCTSTVHRTSSGNALAQQKEQHSDTDTDSEAVSATTRRDKTRHETTTSGNASNVSPIKPAVEVARCKHLRIQNTQTGRKQHCNTATESSNSTALATFQPSVCRLLVHRVLQCVRVSACIGEPVNQ